MTIDCTAARERMLEADPLELEGIGDGDLATHVRSCDACRAAAHRIRAAERALGAALDAVQPRRSADEVASAALAAAASPTVSPLKRRAVRWGMAALPLAAAIAGVLLLAPSPDWGPAPGSRLAALPTPATRVELRPTGNAAVFDVDDDDVTVVWLY